MTVDLAGFLLARINEDETIARPATYESCYIDEGGDWLLPYLDRFSGARMLAECEAKRRFLTEWHQWAIASSTGDDWAFERVARILAVPYADHPDYREEWKP